MKILQVLLVALSLTTFGATSMVWAADNALPQDEMQKGDMPRGPRFHRSMSMAMMKDLSLSDEQKTQWKALIKQKDEELKPIRAKVKELHEEERKISDAYETKIKDLLTAEQKKQYETMMQKKPEMPRNMPPRPDKQPKK